MQNELNTSEKCLLALIVTAFIAFAILDPFVLHPAYAAVDELGLLATLQRHFETGERVLRYAGSSLQHHAFYGMLALFGHSLAVLHSTVLLGMALELWLVFGLVRRLAGSRVALWMLASSLAAALSLMRARSLLSYTWVPMELSALVLCFPHKGQPLKAALWGLTLALVTLEYELWILAMPFALGCALFYLPRGRARLALLGGFVLGAAVVFWLSLPYLATIHAVRSTKTAVPGLAQGLGNLSAHLKDYIVGGVCFPYVAVSQWPAFPVWAWPGLLLGLLPAWRRYPAILLFIPYALLPLAFRSPGLETQRAILAWLPLCFISGLGFATISQELPRRLALLLLLLPVAGFALEARATWRHLEAEQKGVYAAGAAQLQLLQDLKHIEQQQPLWVLDHFDQHSSSAFRFLHPTGPLRSGGLSIAAVLPWYSLPAISGLKGELKTYGEGATQAYFFFPAETQGQALLPAVDGMLDSSLRALPWTDRYLDRAAQLKLILSSVRSHPWVRAVLWKEYLEALHYTGQLTDADLEAVLAEKLPIAEPYRETALREGRKRPAYGIRLMERAAQIDSRIRFGPEERAPLLYYLALEQGRAVGVK